MMKKLFILFALGLFALFAHAQTTTPAPTTQAFGKIDKADLEMTACDFEKGANAEVLFDKGSVFFDQDYNVVIERHVRVKIFNDNGKDEANIRIRYWGGNRYEYISNVQAETVNLTNGAIEVTKVDKKQIFYQPLNKYRTEMVFAFPNVKPGSVIEFKYLLTASSIGDFPDWYFQTTIPTRYSEINTDIPAYFYYKNLVMVNQPFIKNTETTKALANVLSVGKEPRMSSLKDNEQRILYALQTVSMPGFHQSFSDSWTKVGENMLDADDFGGQFKRKLAGEEDILAKAKSLGSDAAKISYIFSEVKKNMKWNEDDVIYTEDGTAEAWTKKTGNSTEINLCLFHLLQKTGLKVYPMLASTRSNGKINPAYPNRYQFNRTVVYFPIDSANYFILDATGKYNIYNEIPKSLLNAFALKIDKDNKTATTLFIQKSAPVREVTLINSEIMPDGKMVGTTQINSFSYNRIVNLDAYKTDGEEKFIKSIQNGNNDLKITALKVDNMDVDTLPLLQNFNFTLNLSGADENYIYFKPNLFSTAFDNEFLSETRLTDIDFSCLGSDAVSGIYKVPAGFKIDAMPKSVSMSMSDNSITFKRIVAAQEGSIVVRYNLNFKKSLFFKEDYPEFHDFFKKLSELMNEQIVLKKG